MTTTYKFYTKDNNNSTNNSSIFLNNKSTNYSEILDDIITADIIKKNSYLFENTGDTIIKSLNEKTNDSPIILTCGNLKFDYDYINATKFLANYKKYNKKYKLPFILGKMYTLSDGTPIVFYNDEIQIDMDLYKYSDFLDLSFINGLTPKKKKTIINIYTSGLGDIDINIL